MTPVGWPRMYVFSMRWRLFIYFCLCTRINSAFHPSWVGKQSTGLLGLGRARSHVWLADNTV